MDTASRQAECHPCGYEDAAAAENDPLPQSPGPHFYFIQTLAGLPSEAIGRMLDDLTFRELCDLQTYREWREAKKMARQTRAMWGG